MKEIDVLLNTSITKVLEYYGIGLKTEGKDRVQMICPFHGDNAPSLLVNIDKNFAHCFGCNKNWDSVEFIRRKEEVGFFDALKKLADIAGLPYDVETLRYIYYNHPEAFSTKDVHRFDKKVDDLVLAIFSEFMTYCRKWPPLFKEFYFYVDNCLVEFDEVVGSDTYDLPHLDKAKDWFFKSKRFIDLYMVPTIEAYQKFKREVQQERTDDDLGAG